METRKNQYTAPRIEIIFLDNEISLQLESNNSMPPTGPGEGPIVQMIMPEYMNNDAFKTNLG